MTAPFRFGLVATVRSRSDWLALARRAEDLGFDSLLVPDNLDGVAPMLACAAAASVTTSLTVGPYVLATPLRTPGLVAAEAAALHLLADGRVEVGLGAGRPDSESEAARLGVPFGSPGERIGVLETTIAAVRDRLPTAKVTVAASGPRMLALAGRTADVVALGASPLADEAELARMAGRRPRGRGRARRRRRPQPEPDRGRRRHPAVADPAPRAHRRPPAGRRRRGAAHRHTRRDGGHPAATPGHDRGLLRLRRRRPGRQARPRGGAAAGQVGVEIRQEGHAEAPQCPISLVWVAPFPNRPVGVGG